LHAPRLVVHRLVPVHPRPQLDHRGDPRRPHGVDRLAAALDGREDRIPVPLDVRSVPFFRSHAATYSDTDTPTLSGATHRSTIAFIHLSLRPLDTASDRSAHAIVNSWPYAWKPPTPVRTLRASPTTEEMIPMMQCSPFLVSVNFLFCFER
jgi:hypothetical protein